MIVYLIPLHLLADIEIPRPDPQMTTPNASEMTVNDSMLAYSEFCRINHKILDSIQD